MAADGEHHDPRPNEARWRLRQQAIRREIRARRTYTPGVASSSRGEPAWPSGANQRHGSEQLTPIGDLTGEDDTDGEDGRSADRQVRL